MRVDALTVFDVVHTHSRLAPFIRQDLIVIEGYDGPYGIRLLLRNAREVGADKHRVLAVLMAKSRDQDRRIVACSVKK